MPSAGSIQDARPEYRVELLAHASFHVRVGQGREEELYWFLFCAGLYELPFHRAGIPAVNFGIVVVIHRDLLPVDSLPAPRGRRRRSFFAGTPIRIPWS
jgi:hypothetical protein